MGQVLSNILSCLCGEDDDTVSASLLSPSNVGSSTDFVEEGERVINISEINISISREDEDAAQLRKTEFSKEDRWIEPYFSSQSNSEIFSDSYTTGSCFSLNTVNSSNEENIERVVIISDVDLTDPREDATQVSKAHVQKEDKCCSSEFNSEFFFDSNSTKSLLQVNTVDISAEFVEESERVITISEVNLIIVPREDAAQLRKTEFSKEYSCCSSEPNSEVFFYSRSIKSLLPVNTVNPSTEFEQEGERGIIVDVNLTDGAQLWINDQLLKEENKWINHYCSSHKILLVGEGDFSFSACLAKAFGSAHNMVATSLDSKGFLERNYNNAISNISKLESRGCMVIHNVDATEMANHYLLQGIAFDRIIYNFPLAGFFKDGTRESQIRKHQKLVRSFFRNAKKLISKNGEIHVSHKSYGFFLKWNLEKLALDSGLHLKEEVQFNLRDYPGYNTKYGFGGNKNFDCRPSKTYKFIC